MPDSKQTIEGMEQFKKCLIDILWFHGTYVNWEPFDACLALLKEQEPVVHCKDCVKRNFDNCPFNEFSMYTPEDNFYCGEGAVKWDA